MPTDLLKKGLSLLLRRQTNILSAAFVIMMTVLLSQVLGLVRQRLLVASFGASNALGVYLASSRLPDLLFQVIIAGALSSAFIPVFSDYLVKNRKEEGDIFASVLLSFSLGVFFIISLVLFIFAQWFSYIVAPGFSESQLMLMANLMRLVLIGEMLFIIGSFYSAILQSYNHFFIPGIAAAMYNLGIILGIVLFSHVAGIFAPAYGVIIGAAIFVVVQIPLVRKVGFSYHPLLYLKNKGVVEVFHLMWPRTISLAIFQVGSLITVTLISFLTNPGRNYVIFDYAQTIAFAPVVLFGQTIAQAAFPVLSRERERLEEFQETFLTSFSQMLYLVLPVSVLVLVLRVPIVRLLYGVSEFDWPATVLTARTLAAFAIGIFAQSLIYLVSRGFYALHDTKTPLTVGAIATVVMLGLGAVSIFWIQGNVITLALAYTIGGVVNFLLLFIILARRLGKFPLRSFSFAVGKVFFATACTAVALYIPIKLLDQLVFDTTRTINLLILTGISSSAGLILYIFLTWLLDVKEAEAFLLLFRRIGNWKEILTRSTEPIESHIKT